MFRLGCVIPNVTDGTSFYRAGGPLQAMEQERPRDIRLEMGGTINWVYLRGVNAVFMQRPYTADHVRVMSFCKLQGKPIWIDYDDDLYSVPFQNPAHKFYSPKQIQNNLTSLIAQADIVSVSTVALKTKLEKIIERFAAAKTDLPRRFLSPDKIVLIPNAYDEKLFAYSHRSWTKPPPDANLCALWRGSNTHDADLAVYTDPLRDAFKADGEKWTLNFVGSPWWGTLKALEDAGIPSERTIVTPPLDPIEYFHFLHRVKPAVVFVPLLGDEFNRSKCLVPGTLVPVNGKGLIAIEDIKIGDQVWREDKWADVVTTYKYEDQPVMRIVTEDGYEISGTPHHKIRSNGQWKSIDQISAGDEIDISPIEFGSKIQTLPMRGFKQQNNRKNTIHEIDLNNEMHPQIFINERWAEFIGIMLGDGTMNAYNRIGVAMSIEHVDMIEKVRGFASSLGLGVTEVKKPGKGFDIYINSVILRQFLAESVGFIGVRNKTLMVPKVIWKSPKKVVASFLRGLFDTDATVGDTSVYLSTKQESLAKEAQILLLGFGIKSKISRQFNQTYRKYYYKIGFGRQGCDIFNKEIGFISREKTEKLNRICEKKHSNAYKEWEWTAKVSSKESLRSDVYDIEVPDGNFYIANGIVSHNSNIAWIEASHAGAVCLAPDWDEWRRPGVILYRDQEDFRQKLSMLLEGGVNRSNLVGRSREFISQNLTLGAVNHERWKIIECLSGIDPWT